MFNTEIIILVILLTIAIFFWCIKTKKFFKLVYFGFFVFLYIIYNGVGAAEENIPKNYLFYYFIFTICISLGIKFGFNNKNFILKNYNDNWKFFFNEFIHKYGNIIIIIYFLLFFLDLLFPENKLMNLIHPPAPDLKTQFFERYQTNNDNNIIISILSFFKIIFYPFYLLSLYKYRKKTIKLTILILAPLYFIYAKTSYVGRGGAMEALLMIILITYLGRPKLGKYMLISFIVATPLIMVLLVQYSIKRIGGIVENISTTDAMLTLLTQETGYQQHFSEILKFQNNPTLNYFIWLFTFPLPGFFRGGIDANFNAYFSEIILGIDRTSSSFYIVLPGLVGESVFLLGKNLFWINGIIIGFLMGYLYKLLVKYPQTIGLFVAVAINFAYIFNRGGMVSGFIFIGKNLLWFFLICYVLKNYTIKFGHLVLHNKSINKLK